MLTLTNQKELLSLKYCLPNNISSPFINFEELLKKAINNKNYLLIKYFINHKYFSNKNFYDLSEFLTTSIQNKDTKIFLILLDSGKYSLNKHSFYYIIRAYESCSNEILMIIFNKIKNELLEYDKQLYTQVKEEVYKYKIKKMITNF